MLTTALSPYASYRVAYVEYRAVSPCGTGSCGAAQRRASVSDYTSFIADAAKQNVDLIVFPEYGITGFSSYSASSWRSAGYTESLPEPPAQSRIVPCDSPSSFRAAPSLVSLSCAAQMHGVAVVANLMDMGDAASNMYNTDIALDTDGAYLAKYHKQNLWGEANVGVPANCPVASFTTRFNVTFGLMTCADLIYHFPASSLLERRVRHFLLPAAWSDEMAQMQVLAFAQGWSLQHNATLVVSNHRTAAESGSGIWQAGRALAYTFAPSANEGSLVFADVDDAWSANANASARAAVPPLVEAEVATVRALAIGNGGRSWRFAELSDGKLCAGRVCCVAEAVQGEAHGWVLAALDGTDTDLGEAQWAAQVCAVLPCDTPSQRCLQYSAPPSSRTASLRALRLSMSGASARTVVFPEAFATSATRGGQVMLTPNGGGSDTLAFATATDGASLNVTAAAGLGSAVLYGRSFDEDQLPYDCPGSSRTPDDGEKSESELAESRPATPRPTPGTLLRHILVPDPDPRLGHRNRTYEVTIPKVPVGEQKLPVLFYFHGQSGTLVDSNSFAELGEATGQFVTVAAKGLSEGVGSAAWSVGTEGRTDVCTEQCEAVVFPSCERVGRVSACNWATCFSDLAFIRLLLAEVTRDFDVVDSARFYAVGASNGAMLSLHLAAAMPGTFKAVVPWYGAFLKGQLPPAGALEGTSLMLLQGGRDETIPEQGGESYDHYLYESSNATVAAFATANGCEADETRPFTPPFDNHPPHSCVQRVGCKHGAAVLFCDFPTQQHGFWPTWAESMSWWFLRTHTPPQARAVGAV